MKILTFIKSNRLLPILFVAAAIIGSCKKGEIGDDQTQAFVKFYGTSFYDQAFEIHEVSDGFIMVGNTTILESGNLPNHSDICIRKINLYGNQVWERSFGNEQFSGQFRGNDEGKDFVIADDGGFVITGYMTLFDSLGNGTRSAYIMKTTSSGNEIWRRVGYEFIKDTALINTGVKIHSGGNNIIKINGQYFIAGTIENESEILSNPSDLLVLRTDEDGISPDYSHENYEINPGLDVVSDLVISNDNPLIIGSTISALDQLNTVMSWQFDINSFDIASADYNNDELNLAEEGVTAVNMDGNINILVNRVSAGRNIVSIEEFQPSASGLSLSLVDTIELTTQGLGVELHALSMSETTDGGFIVTGYILYENQDRDVFLTKISADKSQKWIKIFGSEQLNEQGEKVKQTSDGGYIILGSSGFDGTRVGNTSVMVIKTTSEGELNI